MHSPLLLPLSHSQCYFARRGAIRPLTLAKHPIHIQYTSRPLSTSRRSIALPIPRRRISSCDLFLPSRCLYTIPGHSYWFSASCQLRILSYCSHLPRLLSCIPLRQSPSTFWAPVKPTIIRVARVSFPSAAPRTMLWLVSLLLIPS